MRITTGLKFLVPLILIPLIAYAAPVGKISRAATAGGSGAPTDATYITQTANSSLSAEQALSSLSTGIMRVATTTGVVTSLTDSAGIAANISDETGSGALCFANTPTFVTPLLGTPTSGVLTNCTGLPAASVVAGTFGSGSFVFPGTANFTNNAITASGNAATVPITFKFNTVTNNSAATLTITMTTTSAVNGQLVVVNVLDFSAAAQTITWVNTENSTITAPTTSNGSTTLPKVVGFQYNSATSKWRCIASA